MNLKQLANNSTSINSPTYTSKTQFKDNPEAMRLFELIESKPFIFLTGKGGTGKSTLVKEILKIKKKSTIVVAPTGIAALNIEGQTIHSAFKFKPSLLLEKDIRKTPPSDIFRKLELLIIDEISMVRPDMMDSIDYALRTWRGLPQQPFGGVKILAVGDLLQLPPVVTPDEAELFYSLYESPWFFNANVFNEIDSEVIELNKTYRQSDPIFVDILNRIRSNNDHRESVAKLNRECYRDAITKKADIILCARNAQADMLNQRSLAQITEPATTYTGVFDGNFPRHGRLPAPEKLTLKVGAQVMVTKNIGSAVNGSLGIVTKLEKDAAYLRLKETGEIIKVERETWEKISYTSTNGQIDTNSDGSYEQLPLQLGWAITIHKSQGLTLDNVEIDLGGGAFASGQTYVALSRCKQISGIKLTNPISMRDVITDQYILDFYNNLATSQTS